MHIVQSTVLTLLKIQGDSTRAVFSSATFEVTLHLRAGFRCFFRSSSQAPGLGSGGIPSVWAPAGPAPISDRFRRLSYVSK